MELGQRVGSLEADRDHLLAALEQVTAIQLAMVTLLQEMTTPPAPAAARPHLRLVHPDDATAREAPLRGVTRMRYNSR